MNRLDWFIDIMLALTTLTLYVLSGYVFIVLASAILHWLRS